MPEELWTEVRNIVQEAVIKTNSKTKNGKRLNGYMRRPYKYLRKEKKLKAKETRKEIPISMQISKEWQGEIRRPSLEINAKK